MTSRSRLMFCARVSFISRPLQSEGAGNAGRPMRPIAACAMVEVERTRVSQVTPESPGIPRAMVYGLFRALPGDRAFLPPSPAKVAFRELDASVGASGPHVFAVRLSAVRQERIRVHRIPPPTFVTIAKRPSDGAGPNRYIADLAPASTENSENPKLFRKGRRRTPIIASRHRRPWGARRRKSSLPPASNRI